MTETRTSELPEELNSLETDRTEAADTMDPSTGEALPADTESENIRGNGAQAETPDAAEAEAAEPAESETSDTTEPTETEAAESEGTEAEEKADMPTLQEIEEELAREKKKNRYGRGLRRTIYALVIVAAAAVLLAVLLLPVLKITGTSMQDTLQDGDVVIAVKGSGYTEGDVVAFYYNNSVLVKRVIAEAGDWVDIDEDGTVYVNNVSLDEPYITEKALGDCNIELPYQVPEGKVFIMGDHRATSVDSRNTAVGCVDEDDIIGRLVFRIWPFSSFGVIHRGR